MLHVLLRLLLCQTDEFRAQGFLICFKVFADGSTSFFLDSIELCLKCFAMLSAMLLALCKCKFVVLLHGKPLAQPSKLILQLRTLHTLLFQLLTDVLDHCTRVGQISARPCGHTFTAVVLSTGPPLPAALPDSCCVMVGLPCARRVAVLWRGSFSQLCQIRGP
mmetsp:Transcript_42573/g.120433  ORF Transcript_42573/g.120433 Transcript_42573/m.120433 type:complete len:163 (+) Transcript_42573:483-971(+)